MKSKRLTTIVLSLLLIGFMGGASIAADISGTVTSSGGGPVPNAAVVAYTGSPCSGYSYVKSVGASNVDGTYVLDGLDSNLSYYLRAEDNSGAFVHEWYAGAASTPNCEGALAIDLSSGSQGGVNFQLDTGSTITGVVKDSGGTPIDGTATPITVAAIMGAPCGSKQWIRSTSIDSYGNYTIMGLPVGSYYVQTEHGNSSNYANEWWAEGASVLYADCENADPVQITSPGFTASNKDFQLDPGGTIKGVVRNAAGTPLDGSSAPIRLEASQGDPCGSNRYIQGTNIQSDGSYTMTGLPVGSYIVRAWDSSGRSNYVSEWWAEGGSVLNTNCAGAGSINVSSPGVVVTGKDFQLDLGGAITGFLMDSSSGVTISGAAQIRVNAYQGDPCGSYKNIGGVTMQADGSFKITGLPIGSYFLRTDNQGRSNYVNEWWNQGTGDIQCAGASPVSVPAPDVLVTGKNFQLDIGGSITGVVKDSAGLPIDGNAFQIRVNASQGDPCGAYREFGGVNIRSDGSFTVPGLPPGNYLLRANNQNRYNYVNEWWAEGGSVLPSNCAGAGVINVPSPNAVVTGKDFQLDPGGSIAGTVKDTDGNPLNGNTDPIRVYANSGSPCSSYTNLGGATIQADGSYKIFGLPTGTYYLKTDNQNRTNYVSEWWADGGSVPSADCAGAVGVSISSPGAAVTGKDFQLELGGGITGFVTDSSGVAINGNTTPIRVYAYRGNPCGSNWNMNGANVQADGSYTIFGLPLDQYYLRTDHQNRSNYVNEWWADGASVPFTTCGAAGSVRISAAGELVSGKNFQLNLGSSISGRVMDSSGNPITSVQIQIAAKTGTPCGSNQWVTSNTSSTVDGTYTIWGLPLGSYYLQTDNMQRSQYVNEWWTGQSPDPSTHVCSSAQAVTLSSTPVTGKDFSLTLGGTISGRVTSDEGPLGGMYVGVYTSRCGSSSFMGASTDENGDYTVIGVPPSPVYLRVGSSGSTHLGYIDVWYDGATGHFDCNQVDPLTVASGVTQTGVNFDLDKGIKRVAMWQMRNMSGNLQSAFKVQEGFQELLTSATLTMPNQTRGTYTYDLNVDVLNWTAECAFNMLWNKIFTAVETADYGPYTLTLDFSDGVRQVYTTVFQEKSVVPASNIVVIVNSNGSANVTWNRDTSSDQLYMLDVREGSAPYQRLFATGYELNISSKSLTATDLRCLEIGKTYQFRVATTDTTQQAWDQPWVSVAYNPTSTSVTSRLSSYTVAVSDEGKLHLELLMRPGSRGAVKSATVSGPNGFSYTFDLTNDLFDISTATSPSSIGWRHEEAGWPLTSGTYTFTVNFDDDGNGTPDYQEVATRTVTSFAAVTPVDPASMSQIIFQDGAIQFNWALPSGVTGQVYEVRIYSPSRDKRYYASSTMTDGNTVTVWFGDLRAMEPGQEYQWLVRASSPDLKSLVETSRTFLYDPSPVYDATAAVFNENSSVLTNPYMPMALGARLNYAGIGSIAGYGRYIAAVGEAVVDGVNCLEVVVKGSDKNPDPEQDSDWFSIWLAQDTVGNIWMLQYYEYDGDRTETLERANAMLWFPGDPVVGRIFQQMDEDFAQVQLSGVTVPQLSTGPGPFTNSLKILTAFPYAYRDQNNNLNTGTSYDVQYLAPNVGIVKELWNVTGQGSVGWELLSASPFIVGITPAPADVGSVVTITGMNFSASQGTGYVTFNNGITATEVTSWSDTQIQCVVPADAVTGCVTVTTDQGNSNCFQLSVQAPYTITATAGPHGTITPSGVITVIPGQGYVFTFTPDPGHHIEQVIVDGSSIGAPPDYSFGIPTANHTIQVTFAMTDTDGDGLSDYDEINIYHTDPYRSDTDGDGMTDGEEVEGTYGYVTNPLLADTDGDGFWDGWEIGRGSNPADPGSVPAGLISGTVIGPSGSGVSNVYVEAYTGNPCGGYWLVKSVLVTESDGTYVIEGLDPAAGPYYLKAKDAGVSDYYVREWYAEPASTSNCEQAVPINLSSGGYGGADFQLDWGSRISGMVKNVNNVPINGSVDPVVVIAYRGSPCGYIMHAEAANVQADGSYTISGLGVGTYYLKANNNNWSNYVSAWWSQEGGSLDCSVAKPVQVTGPNQVVSGKDFKLVVGGAVTGLVMDSAGNAINGTTTPINVQAITGDPCGSRTNFPGAGIAADGTYTLMGLPAGNVYLQTNNRGSNFVNEWWVNTAGESNFDCHNAQPFVITAGSTATGGNFKLDSGTTISGTVMDMAGSGVTTAQIQVNLYSGSPCGQKQSIAWATASMMDGTYTLAGVPSGTWYLQTWYQLAGSGSTRYVNEWYTGASPDPSSWNCQLAQAVPVSTTPLTGKDFKLESGGAIFGRVVESGVTPIQGIRVQAYSAKCSGANLGYGDSAADGTYMIAGLPFSAAPVYVQAYNNGTAYMTEWYNGGAGTTDCNGATAVSVGSTGINFDLVIPGSISGRVMGDDGPLGGMLVLPFSTKCGGTSLAGTNTDDDGYYTLTNLTPGQYYLLVKTGATHLNYVAVWYDGGTGWEDCNKSIPLTVVSGQNLTGKDFYLADGLKRLRMWQMRTHTISGIQYIQSVFSVQDGFINDLVSATLEMPNPSRETYDYNLSADFLNWDVECGYAQLWNKLFQTTPVPADYGTYMLTLTYADGVVQTHNFTLQNLPVVATTVTQAVFNSDGSATVTWDRNTSANYQYQVEVRDAVTNKRMFASGGTTGELNINSKTLTASDLKCLEVGKSYNFRVVCFDSTSQSWDTQQTASFTYNPTSLQGRVTANRVWSLDGSLYLGLDVRGGSRGDVQSATVTGPDGFSYTFDLSGDWYDFTTGTRLDILGWRRLNSAWPVTGGTYTFTVKFDDDNNGSTDYEETKSVSFSPASLIPVDPTSMKATIYQDGAISFSWALPQGTTQNYMVRIRNLDGTKEYYASGPPAVTNMSSVTAGYDNPTANLSLRAMEVGQMYKWTIYTYSADGNTCVRTDSAPFMYNPWPVYDATAAVFNANSSVLTHLYMPMALGTRLNYTGTGGYAGYGRYMEAVDEEVVDGVKCLKLVIKGNGNDHDPESDAEWDFGWFAQDAEGNIWVLKFYNHEKDGEDRTVTLGRANAIMWLPVDSVKGQIFRQNEEEFAQVVATGVTTQLTTGLGPYTNSLKILSAYPYSNRSGQQVNAGFNSDLSYLAPNVGVVMEQWSISTQTVGWDLQSVVRLAIKGDVSGDGALGLEDVILALQVVQGLNPSGVNLSADVDGDGKIGLAEAIYILQFLSQLR